MTNAEIAGIVYAETKDLRELPGTGMAGSLDVARPMIAGLAAADVSKVFTNRIPPAGDASAAILAAALNAGRLVQPGDDQPRLLLWESAAGDVPDRVAALPAPWGGLAANAITAHGAFSAFDKVIWLFSRGSGTDGNSKGPVFASCVTGTGLAAGTAMANPVKASPPNIGSAWAVGIASVLLLVFCCVWCVDLSAGLARPPCAAPANGACVATGADGTPVKYKDGKPDKSALPWRTGLQNTAARFAYVIPEGAPAAAKNTNSAGGTAWAETDRFSAIPVYLLTLAAMFGLLAAVGLAANGHIAGALIDQRNRMSLTLTQAAAWGAVMFSALIVYSLLNIGYLAINIASLGDALGKAMPKLSSAAPLFAIAGGSALASKLTLHLTGTPQAATAQAGAPPATAQQDGGTQPAIPGNLDRNASAADASLWDIVLSEQAGQAQLIDMNRVQAAAMTIVVLSVFVSALLATLSVIAPQIPYTSTALLPGLPELSTEFITILLASHGALLGGKWMTQRTADGQGGQT